MAMWVKMSEKETLRDIFYEAIKLEKEMSSLGTNPKSRENTYHHPRKKNKEIKLNKEGK